MFLFFSEVTTEDGITEGSPPNTFLRSSGEAVLHLPSLVEASLEVIREKILPADSQAEAFQQGLCFVLSLPLYLGSVSTVILLLLLSVFAAVLAFYWIGLLLALGLYLEGER